MKKDLSEKIYRKALECGYDNCGIISVDDISGYELHLKERMEKVPSSQEFYRDLERFIKIKEKNPWAKSIIVCSVWLGKYKYPVSLQGKYAKAYMLSPNSVPDSEEYQNKIRFEQWLKQEGIHYKGGPDSGPGYDMPLRESAVAAGLGIIRKNNFFYGEKGSYYELEGYLIDQECEYKHTVNLKPCSEKCNLCRRACKTCALFDEYTMNPNFCTSFLNTFAGGVIPKGIKEEQLEDWICGCDACQDACPYNRHEWDKGEEFYKLKEIEELLKPENLIQASDEELCKYVIPKTVRHIMPEQVDVLRKSAERAMASNMSKCK